MTSGISNRRVFLFYGLLVFFFSSSRISSAGWHAYIEPMDLRLIDNHVIQYEAQIELRAASMHLLPSASTLEYFSYYSSEEYRAILPIISAAALSGVLHSYYWGFFGSECLWWWGSSIAMFYLVTVFDSRRAAATIGGALIASSPLASVHIGAANLHASSSLGLVFVLIIVLYGNYAPLLNLRMILRSSFAFLFSSIVYSYQWFIIPTILVARLVLRDLQGFFSGLFSLLCFMILTNLLSLAFSFSGIEVHSHLNDSFVVLSAIYPKNMTQSDLSGIYEPALVFTYIQNIFIGAISVLIKMPSYYSYPIFLLSLLGFFNGSRYFQAYYIVSIALASISGMIRGYPYVIMAAFPFVYSGAGTGFVEFLWIYRRFRARFCLEYLPSDRILSYFLLFILISLTNIDIVGNYSFARDWFAIKYKPF